MIRITGTKANVNPAFFDLLVQTADELKTRLTKVRSYLQDNQLQHFYTENEGAIRNIAKFLDPANHDRLFTELRSLSIAEYSVTAANFYHVEDPYSRDCFPTQKYMEAFKITTRDIVLEKYNLGPYVIYIPIPDLLCHVTAHFHLTPLWNPMEEFRHPHHIAYSNPASTGPTELKTYTCFGDFNNIIIALIKNFDVVALTRNLTTYLSRFKATSPIPDWRWKFGEWSKYENYCRARRHAISDDTGINHS